MQNLNWREKFEKLLLDFQNYRRQEEYIRNGYYDCCRISADLVIQHNVNDGLRAEIKLLELKVEQLELQLNEMKQ